MVHFQVPRRRSGPYFLNTSQPPPKERREATRKTSRSWYSLQKLGTSEYGS